MSLTTKKQRSEQAASTSSPAGPRAGRAGARRAGLATVAILLTGVLVAACGGGSPASSAAQPGSSTSLQNAALRYTDCMRTHGEPNMPEPSFNGRHATLDIDPGSGVNPSSPQFAAATTACGHLLAKGGTSPATTITPADQDKYLKAVACMRSRGFPAFPDPEFKNNSVTFDAPGSSIDTNSSRYKSALMTCEKLIPAGLPYSGPGGS
jgi:hypothetical protein